MFTFVTISYNQERYIVEHLESIKYQIQNFGKGKAISYVLSDDASTDSTVAIAKKWLEENEDLFQDYRVLEAGKNQGIVQNYLKATQSVQTEKYKLLAGDDLYYINNIFAAIEDEDVIFTPVLSFNGKDIIPDKSIPFIMNDNKKMIKHKLTYYNLFNAPGTFFSKEVFRDQNLIEFLGQYSWIEDLPTWYYLFNIRKNLAFQVKEKPYVLYRISEGVSNNKKNKKRTAFEAEEELINKTFKIKLSQKKKLFNPDIISWYMLLIKYHFVDKKFKENVKTYNDKALTEIEKAKSHLNYLSLMKDNFHLTASI